MWISSLFHGIDRLLGWLTMNKLSHPYIHKGSVTRSLHAMKRSYTMSRESLVSWASPEMAFLRRGDGAEVWRTTGWNSSLVITSFKPGWDPMLRITAFPWIFSSGLTDPLYWGFLGKRILVLVSLNLSRNAPSKDQSSAKMQQSQEKQKDFIGSGWYNYHLWRWGL